MKVFLPSQYMSVTFVVLPDISLPAVALSTDHLRAHPVGGAGDRADAGARHADGLQPLAGTKISKLHVARGIPQDVGPWEPELTWNT